jgi:SAM-dependent methyltransferase
MTNLDPIAIWDQTAADQYDTPGTGIFAAEVIAPTVDCLRRLAGPGAALEFAIGTGRIGLPLAQTGVPVSGIESSPHMLARLREKPGAERIAMMQGDMETAHMPGQFTLVYLVCNTIANILTQDGQIACFRNAARHLAPGGRFVIELWVPSQRQLPPGAPGNIVTARPGYIGLDTWDILRSMSCRITLPSGRVARQRSFVLRSDISGHRNWTSWRAWPALRRKGAGRIGLAPRLRVTRPRTSLSIG